MYIVQLVHAYPQLFRTFYWLIGLSKIRPIDL
jgi:hypothetical protein